MKKKTCTNSKCTFTDGNMKKTTKCEIISILKEMSIFSGNAKIIYSNLRKILAAIFKLLDNIIKSFIIKSFNLNYQRQQNMMQF